MVIFIYRIGKRKNLKQLYKLNLKMYLHLLLFLFFMLMACSQTKHSPQLLDKQKNSPAAIGIVGDTVDVKTNHKAGFLLAGGGADVDAAMKWLAEHSDGGDLVIIRASGGTGYNQYLYDLHKVNSVETLLINSRALAGDSYVIRRLKEAEAVFIAGGDQANYINFWKETPVEAALNYLINEKKVAIGGTSAGSAVLGEGIYDALTGSIISAEALANPYHTFMSLQTSNFLKINLFKSTIIDTHYSQRDRQGRHFTFLARLYQDYNWKQAKGIGVDERTAVCIEPSGKLQVVGENYAYFLINQTEKPEVCQVGQPLTWERGKNAVRTYEIKGNTAHTFDLNTWEGEGGAWKRWYAVEGKFEIIN